MFTELQKESKIIVRCVSYWVFILMLAAAFFMPYQTELNHDLKMAQKGIPLYGTVGAEVPEKVMRNVTYRLFRDTSNNEYDIYVFGMIPVHKSLKAEERDKVFALFEKITGETLYQVDQMFYNMDLEKLLDTRDDMSLKQARAYLKKDYYKKLADEFEAGSEVIRLYQYEDFMPIREDLSYEKFMELIGELKIIIGRKTVAYDDLERYEAEEPVSALPAYEEFIDTQGASVTYARLLSDYMTVAALIPAFIAAEARKGGLIRRKGEGTKAVLAELRTSRTWIRFVSIVIMTFLPLFIFTVAAARELAAGVRKLMLTADPFTFIHDTTARLMPFVILAAAAGLAAAWIAAAWKARESWNGK